MSLDRFFRAPLAAVPLFFTFFHVVTVHGSAVPAENWVDLSVSGSNLRTAPPVVGEIDDFPEFTRQIVKVQWRERDPIYLYVLIPKLVPRPPVILYLYDYRIETAQFLSRNFCKLLTAQGVAAVGFAPALSGQRYHDRPMEQWFVSELQESLGTTVHDVHMILDYLTWRGDFDMNRVGMFGDGSGGAIAVLAAAADPRIKAIDLLDPWGGWPAWMAESTVVPEEERQRFLTSAYLDSIRPLDPVRWLPALKIPIRIQYLRSDGATPERSQNAMNGAAPRQTCFVSRTKGIADYRTSRGANFLDWLKTQLAKAPNS